MNDNTQILEIYKNADFEKRLNFFLSYRSLRNQFAKIDNRERKSSCVGSIAIKPMVEKRPFFHWLLLRWGIEKAEMK